MKQFVLYDTKPNIAITAMPNMLANVSFIVKASKPISNTNMKHITQISSVKNLLLSIVYTFCAPTIRARFFFGLGFTSTPLTPLFVGVLLYSNTRSIKSSTYAIGSSVSTFITPA